MARKPARKAKTRKAPKAKRASAPKRRSAPAKAKRPKRSTAGRANGKSTPKRATSKKAKASKQRVAAKKPAGKVVKKAAPKKRAGGTGRESTLDQTPATGRTIRTGPTNPMPTRRSTGTASGAGDTRRAPGLERERKQLREIEESMQQAPSSLNMDRHGSAARTGRAAPATRRKSTPKPAPR